MWEKLESLYSSKSGNNKLFLLKKMMALKYKEGTSAADHGIITLDLVMSGVLNEEVRRRSQGSTSQSEVLVTENRGRNREKYGHIKKYCFKLKRENKGGGGDKHNRNDEEKFKRAVVTHEDLLVICDENLINLACDETSWVIDIGASIHVTLRRDFFTSYTPGDFGVLKMGNDGLVSVTGMSNVSLVRNNGTKLILKDVRHAPDIRLNLISARKLDDDGFCNTFSDGQWKLTKGSLVVARWKKSSNLYLILYDPVQKKLMRSRDVVFIEDQTIDDIDKTEKYDSLNNGDLTDVNPVPLDLSPNPVQDDVHGDVSDDQQDICDFDAHR
ncbi:hypothetical protein V6N11_054026 [Hibiscus sabdariffa]|uniref:Retrovirus-related Pol polyprotein from transposon TNT 1-94-like beta-barrel domain-containing protein n=1 Tax=Hibiscus sabdariffa TaxID=183260 RepID=A0ABR2S392_9ROSI